MQDERFMIEKMHENFNIYLLFKSHFIAKIVYSRHNLVKNMKTEMKQMISSLVESRVSG